MKSINILLFENNILFTDRLNLRPVTINDSDEMFKYTSSPTITKYVTFNTQHSLEECKENIINYFIASPLGKYAITLRGSDDIIGTIDIRVNEATKTAELGFVLSEEFQGKGYMTEACIRLIVLSFEVLDLNLVRAKCNALNIKSEQVMKRVGMKYDGTIRQSECIKNKIVDMKYYSISKEEFHTK